MAAGAQPNIESLGNFFRFATSLLRFLVRSFCARHLKRVVARLNRWRLENQCIRVRA
jgi:hypothetical protein